MSFNFAPLQTLRAEFALVVPAPGHNTNRFHRLSRTVQRSNENRLNRSSLTRCRRAIVEWKTQHRYPGRRRERCRCIAVRFFFFTNDFEHDFQHTKPVVGSYVHRVRGTNDARRTNAASRFAAFVRGVFPRRIQLSTAIFFHFSDHVFPALMRGLNAGNYVALSTLLLYGPASFTIKPTAKPINPSHVDSEGYNESTKRFIRPDRIGFQNSISSDCTRGQRKRLWNGTGRGAIM